MRYVCGSIEAQTRQLADCAYLLGDYSTALTAYRQVRVQQARAHNHHPPTLITTHPSDTRTLSSSHAGRE